MSSMESSDAVSKAQEIVDSLVDIRPEYSGRRVLSVERHPEPNTVVIHFDAGPKMRLIGLLAQQILVCHRTSDKAQWVGNPPEITISSPRYYEDDEACGYCQRQPGTKHEVWCRQ